MDVIGFLFVSLGSSTVQFHESLGSRCACSEAGFSSQNGDRVWGVYYPRTRFCYTFFVGKRTQCKDIHKEMFPVYGGKCLSRKAVHNWVEKFSQGRLKVADDAQPGHPGAEVAETRVIRFLCWRVQCIGKAMGQVYQCRWRVLWEIKVFFFPRFEYHMFYVLHPFVTHLLTLPHTI
jgi:hypothetical protein